MGNIMKHKGNEMKKRFEIKVLNPKSSESWIPFFVIDSEIRFGWFLQIQEPFGLYIRCPFFFLRWGSA